MGNIISYLFKFRPKDDTESLFYRTGNAEEHTECDTGIKTPKRLKRRISSPKTLLKNAFPFSIISRSPEDALNVSYVSGIDSIQFEDSFQDGRHSKAESICLIDNRNVDGSPKIKHKLDGHVFSSADINRHKNRSSNKRSDFLSPCLDDNQDGPDGHMPKSADIDFREKRKYNDYPSKENLKKRKLTKSMLNSPKEEAILKNINLAIDMKLSKIESWMASISKIDTNLDKNSISRNSNHNRNEEIQTEYEIKKNYDVILPHAMKNSIVPEYNSKYNRKKRTIIFQRKAEVKKEIMKMQRVSRQFEKYFNKCKPSVKDSIFKIIKKKLEFSPKNKGILVGYQTRPSTILKDPIFIPPNSKRSLCICHAKNNLISTPTSEINIAEFGKNTNKAPPDKDTIFSSEIRESLDKATSRNSNVKCEIGVDLQGSLYSSPDTNKKEIEAGDASSCCLNDIQVRSCFCNQSLFDDEELRTVGFFNRNPVFENIVDRKLKRMISEENIKDEDALIEMSETECLLKNEFLFEDKSRPKRCDHKCSAFSLKKVWRKLNGKGCPKKEQRRRDDKDNPILP